MSELPVFATPTAYCKDCGRRRDATLHRRAEVRGPAEAAMDWLYRTCPSHTTDRERRVRRGSMSARNCAIRYGAGLGLTRPCGQ